jgi:hypothetical protein
MGRSGYRAGRLKIIRPKRPELCKKLGTHPTTQNLPPKKNTPLPIVESGVSHGRGDWIRTSDRLLPKWRKLACNLDFQ